MSVDVYWRRLLHGLRGAGDVREEADRLVVSVDRSDGGRRDVVIVMTPDQWDDMASVAWGDVDAAATWVVQAVRELGPEHRYLVYRTYDLVPANAAELPQDPGLAAIDAHFAEHPEDIGKGGWYARPPE